MDKVFDKWTFARFQKVLSLAFGVCMLSLALTACGDSSDDVAGGSAEEEGIIAIKDKTVSGVSQKGPFVNGSSVQLFELNGKTYAPTGRTFPGKISNDKGEFKIAGINLESQYAFLEASGYYRNEVTGEKSAAPITLNAISDLSKRETVNINLLTHLEYERVMKLVEDGMSIAEAKKQAEQEVFAAFGIEGDFDNSEDLNIFESGDADAALLAISILLQGERSEADLSELLANFAQDIAEDGKWDDEKKKAEIADWVFNVGYAHIRNNVDGWNLGDVVQPFEKYLNNFWWQNFGLGDCSKENQLEVKQNSNLLSGYNETHFICDINAWRIATDVEKDTYNYSCTEGNVKEGRVNLSMYYLCFNEKWRKATPIEVQLGGCTKSIENAISVFNENEYLCKKEKWTIKKDTITDERDGKKYGIVKIGNQFWFAQNLNYSDSNTTTLLKGASWCYDNLEENCDIYGRLYTWCAAIDKGICDMNTSYEIIGTRRGICPSGWHVPNDSEWNAMKDYVVKMENDGEMAGLKLMANSWNLESNDEYGFSALPTGIYAYDHFDGLDNYTYMWSSSAFPDGPHLWGIDGNELWQNWNHAHAGQPIRCVKDSE